MNQLTSNGDATESKPRFNIQNIIDMMSRRKHDGICDKPIFVPFHSSNHSSLSHGRLVMVYNTDSPKKLGKRGINTPELIIVA